MRWIFIWSWKHDAEHWWKAALCHELLTLDMSAVHTTCIVTSFPRAVLFKIEPTPEVADQSLDLGHRVHARGCTCHG